MSEEWKVAPLGRHCSVKARIGWRGLSSSEYSDDGPFLIAGKHVRNGEIDWGSCDHITEFRYRESMEIALEPGDVILTKDGTIGRVARVDYLPGKATLNGTMMLLRASDGLDYRYLFHALRGQQFKRLIDDKVSGSSIPHIFQRDMVTLPIALPPSEQQQGIADVLDSLDTAIRQTEAVIQKLSQVKQGLLHDLLTRGVDANGELRPLQSQAPHLYRDSPLGWIPRTWALPPIRAVVAETANGASIRPDEFRTAGVPVIAKGDVTAAKYIDTSRRIQFVAPELAATKYKGSMINREFVVCSMRDLVASAPTLGMASMLDAPLDGLLAQGTTALRLDTGRFYQELFVELTRLPWFRTKMRALAVGSTQVHMRGRDYFDVMIPAPPIEEQQAIVARVQAIDRSMALHQDSSATLNATKAGLMDDLLTGRVRVTPMLA